jgi:CheY-like chemotaxis protein
MEKILIIEPHEEVRELFARIVTRIGHEAVAAAGGELPASGIGAAIVEPAAEGGLEAVCALREAGIPVVCVSIYPPPPADVIALDPVAYLLKPFSLTELEHALHAALRPTREPAAA